VEKPVWYPCGGVLWGVMVCATVEDATRMAMRAARTVSEIILIFENEWEEFESDEILHLVVGKWIEKKNGVSGDLYTW
jgi:hypothetical protein